MSRALPAILALACLPTSALAQHVLFEEAFELGIPATWRNIQLAWGGDRWRPLFKLVDGTEKIVGYTESSRGCKHLCRHCPVVPVYDGIFRIVQKEIVLEDGLASASPARVTPRE